MTGAGVARHGCSRRGPASLVPARQAGPVEVWLVQRNLVIKGLAVREDETAASFAARSLNMRGAQREVSAVMASAGYTPSGRWEVTANNSAGTEVMRRFR